MYKNAESLTLASPLSRSYWRTALGELRNLRMLTLAAVVVALRIVLSGLYIPLGDNLHIYGLFLYRARFTVWRVLWAKLSVNLLVNVAMGSLWSAILYSKGYYYYLVKGLTKNLLLLPVETVLLFLFLKAAAPFCVRMGLVPRQERASKEKVAAQGQEIL